MRDSAPGSPQVSWLFTRTSYREMLVLIAPSQAEAQRCGQSGRDGIWSLRHATPQCLKHLLCALCIFSRKTGVLVFGKCKTAERIKAGSANPPVPACPTKYQMNILFACLLVYIPTLFQEEFEAVWRMYAQQNRKKIQIQHLEPEKHK